MLIRVNSLLQQKEDAEPKVYDSNKHGEDVEEILIMHLQERGKMTASAADTLLSM